MTKLNKVMRTIRAIVKWITPLDFPALIKDIKYIWK